MHETAFEQQQRQTRQAQGHALDVFASASFLCLT